MTDGQTWASEQYQTTGGRTMNDKPLAEFKQGDVVEITEAAEGNWRGKVGDVWLLGRYDCGSFVQCVRQSDGEAGTLGAYAYRARLYTPKTTLTFGPPGVRPEVEGEYAVRWRHGSMAFKHLIRINGVMYVNKSYPLSATTFDDACFAGPFDIVLAPPPAPELPPSLKVEHVVLTKGGKSRAGIIIAPHGILCNGQVLGRQHWENAGYTIAPRDEAEGGAE